MPSALLQICELLIKCRKRTVDKKYTHPDDLDDWSFFSLAHLVCFILYQSLFITLLELLKWNQSIQQEVVSQLLKKQ